LSDGQLYFATNKTGSATIYPSGKFEFPEQTNLAKSDDNLYFAGGGNTGSFI